VNSDGQSREVLMTFQEGSSEQLLVTPLAPNLYRLEMSSVLGEARRRDIVETEPQTDARAEWKFWFLHPGSSDGSPLEPGNEPRNKEEDSEN
jgi:hypothetical protein